MPAPPNPSALADGVGYTFALLPDETARDTLIALGERLRMTHRLGGTPIAAAALHVELCPMGRPERLYQPPERALLAAAATVRAPEFRVTLDAAMRLRTHAVHYPLVLCADSATGAAMLALRKAIAAAQAGAGLPVAGVTGYSPYLALLQGDTFNTAEEPVSSVQWLARDFVLIRRYFGGLRHEVVGCWPLQPEPAAAPVNLLDELAGLSGFPLPADD